MAPDCLRQSISVLPPSKYNLRRNHDSGILLATPKVRKKNHLKNRLKTSLFSKAFNKEFLAL